MAVSRTILLAFAVVFLVPNLAWVENLCPPHKPLPKGVDELRMAEGDFTFSKAIESFHWLEIDVWVVIKRHKTTEELLHDTEQFGIPFPNSITKIKGALLYQQAMLERERFEIARLRFEAGSGTKADVETVQRRFENARREFCKFVETAKWVD